MSDEIERLRGAVIKYMEGLATITQAFMDEVREQMAATVRPAAEDQVVPPSACTSALAHPDTIAAQQAQAELAAHGTLIVYGEAEPPTNIERSAGGQRD